MTDQKRQTTPLEDLCEAMVKRGQEWAEKNCEAEQLNKLLPHLEAAIMNQVEAESPTKLSEDKLKRLARGSSGYRDAVIEACRAKKEANDLRVRYDGLQELLRVKVSEHVTQRKQEEIQRHV